MTKKYTIVVNIKLSKELYDKLTKYAEEQYTNRASIIRQLISKLPTNTKENRIKT